MGKITESIKVKQKKDLLQMASGITLIILTFIANGFLSFITVGFDFAKIQTTQYWASFSVMFVSEMCVMFGMFIMQRIKDLTHKKITTLQKKIDKQRLTVYGVDKITEAENWLREIYNYREKLILYENKVRKLHSRIILNEPHKNDKNYNKKIEQYNKRKDKRDFYVSQLEYIKKDKERINLLLLKNKDDDQLARINCLNIELEAEDYAFRNAKIHYKDVYWGNLLSDIEETRNNNGSPFFSERKELTKNLLKYLGYGMITSSFLAALIFPSFNNVGWQIFINIIVNLITLIFFMARGITLSNRIILGTYYNALEKRNSIYNQMLKDLNISRIVIEDDELENGDNTNE